MERQINFRILIAVAITLLFWASAFAGIRAGLKAYSPGHLVLLRFIIASVGMAGYASLARMRMPEKSDLPVILILGFLGITGYHVPLVFGEVTVTAGAASLLIASGPIFTALLATLFLGERLKVWGWLGIGVNFCLSNSRLIRSGVERFSCFSFFLAWRRPFPMLRFERLYPFCILASFPPCLPMWPGPMCFQKIQLR